MSHREFRSPESHYAEQVTRNMIEGFLIERGFSDVRDLRKFHGSVESQTIHAISPDNKKVIMKVRLCWRRRNPKDTYSAAQILPNIKNGEWEGTLYNKIKHEMAEGITHTLFIQREQHSFSYAALIPQDNLLEIWCAQRDASIALIQADKLGRRKKNHAMNGSSPTLWLNDDNAPEVNEALWGHPAVLDLAKLQTVQLVNSDSQDDTYDDLLGLDDSLLGSDGGPRTTGKKSFVKRDPKVRNAVILRANGKCEKDGCSTHRDYAGFLDVHHILGVGKSDRVYNCVALCPNCHREAHASPDQEQINALLLNYAMQFKTHATDQD